MATTPGGTYYAASSELVSSWPATSLNLANQLESRFAAKAPTASPAFTGNLVWSAATLRTATAEVLTAQTTTSGSYTDLATSGPAVTVTTGTKALVIIRAEIDNNTNDRLTAMSVSVSGATTVSAADKWSLAMNIPTATYPHNISMAYLFTGLTAGSNTFTCKYRADGGGSVAKFTNRVIAVFDMGS